MIKYLFELNIGSIVYNEEITATSFKDALEIIKILHGDRVQIRSYNVLNLSKLINKESLHNMLFSYEKNNEIHYLFRKAIAKFLKPSDEWNFYGRNRFIDLYHSYFDYVSPVLIHKLVNVLFREGIYSEGYFHKNIFYRKGEIISTIEICVREYLDQKCKQYPNIRVKYIMKS